jgi:hypothetical protein
MQFQKFGSRFVVRLDRGEEIVATLQKFCAEQKISLGTVSGIGAVEHAILGFFETATKKYLARELPGGFELVPLAGNISTQDGKIYLHLHANFADAEQKTFGGHLSSAVVSATCEIFIEQIDGAVEREFDEEIGLNLLKFISPKKNVE